MSWFKNAMADMAARKGARKLKTTITRKTEDGNVTVTVKGVVATDAETLSEKAAELGVTVAGKGGSYGAAEGSQGFSLVDQDAAECVELVCNPDSYQDTEEVKKSRKRGPKADTMDPSLNGTAK
jgi:hypothetical protein